MKFIDDIFFDAMNSNELPVEVFFYFCFFMARTVKKPLSGNFLTDLNSKSQWATTVLILRNWFLFFEIETSKM